MTLYVKDKNYKVWRGERINDILHPKTIEQLWTTEQLNEIGLYRENPNEVPAEPIQTDNTANNILNAPEQGFGGPTAKEIINGNR